jgi:hypothetical protein
MLTALIILVKPYLLCLGSSETVRRFLPRALRAAIIFRPFLVLIRRRKPCLFLRLRFEGWKVIDIYADLYILCVLKLECKDMKINQKIKSQ